MYAYLLEWLNLLARWTHLVVGIAWIGSSFYFVWLDNHLLTPKSSADADKGVGGELWSVHGGGFYHAQKYRGAPGELPKTLHWFYWEAYSTFLSGFFLLCLLYYVQADVYLIDPSVMALSQPAAVLVGLGTLGFGWLIYDALCRSPVGRDPQLLGGVIAALVCVAAWALCQVFSGRGAYLHFGAMLGTIMVANVFFVIIPGQRKMVASAARGEAPDPIHGLRGKQRSVHNTYFTLPVLFVMISNHYAMTYGSAYNWLVLIAISAAGAAVRVWFVARHKAHERGGKTSFVPVAIAIALMAALMVALAPRPVASPAGASISFAQVQTIVAQRCAGCHAQTPTQPGFVAAPKGVLLDTPDHILAQTATIGPQIASGAMPIGNLSGMTAEERQTVLAWIAAGAAP